MGEESNNKQENLTNEKKKVRKNIKKLLEEETKLKQEYLNHLQRLQAEFENYQKRIEQEKQEFIKYCKQDLILKLLDILDNFEIALKNKKNNEEFKRGINLIYKQLNEILEKEGVKQIKEDAFNPEKHEIIAVQQGEENKILEEFQKGYMLYDKTIRTAKVKVSKKNNNNQNSNNLNMSKNGGFEQDESKSNTN